MLKRYESPLTKKNSTKRAHTQTREEEEGDERAALSRTPFTLLRARGVVERPKLTLDPKPVSDLGLNCDGMSKCELSTGFQNPIPP
jgi:hypothetical protein